MANVFESKGFPTVVISALDSIPAMMGVRRYLPGVRIPHPCSDPRLGRGEFDQRMDLLRKAVHQLEEVG
jgi:hypothetical protein